MKLPKRLIEKHGITKKAWQVFRAERGGKKTVRKKKRSKSKKKKVIHHSKPREESQKKGQSMGRRRKKIKHHAKRALRGARRHVSRAAGSRPGQMVIGALEMAGGAVASSLLVNKLPLISTQTKTVKILAQTSMGASLIFMVKNRHAKIVGSGMIISAALGAMKNFFNLEPLAGPSMGARTLAPSELQKLARGQMGMPSPVQMGMPSPVQMGAPGFRRAGFGG